MDYGAPEPIEVTLTRALDRLAEALQPLGDTRLPTHWAGRRIVMRVPYLMPGEVTVAAQGNGDFDSGDFLHSTDKPFEIHDVIGHAAQLTNAIPVADPAPDIGEFWRVTIEDFTKNQVVTKAAALARTVFDADSFVWRWRAPYVLLNSEGFRVNVQNIIAAGGASIRAAVAFRGFLLVLEPPAKK